MKKPIFIFLAVAGLLVVAVIAIGLWLWRGQLQQAAQRPQDEQLTYQEATAAEAGGDLSVATFAGGCFWCMEPPFEEESAVKAVISGFSGGTVEHPPYEMVAAGETDHREAIQVFYDPAEISYEGLLDIYWRQIDPTDKSGQFVDRGFQYSPAIFVHDTTQEQLAMRSKEIIRERDIFSAPIVVPIEQFTSFYPAEEYHQNYYQKNPIRYKGYRQASGRPQFIAENWDDVAPLFTDEME